MKLIENDYAIPKSLSYSVKDHFICVEKTEKNACDKRVFCDKQSNLLHSWLVIGSTKLLDKKQILKKDHSKFQFANRYYIPE